jgi:hypothetical protein
VPFQTDLTFPVYVRLPSSHRRLTESAPLPKMQDCVGHEPVHRYAPPSMMIRQRNTLLSADPGAGQPSGLRVDHPVRHGAGPPPPQPGRAHIHGGAARLTEARVSITQRKTKRRPGAFAAERRRAAPYTRPDKISASMFLLVRGVHSNPLRSRARRFESCRGH